MTTSLFNQFGNTSVGSVGVGEEELHSLVNMIRDGGAYVNVHTTENENGEVRDH